VTWVPAHAGRLRPLERCVFVLVFAVMGGFVVAMAFMATTSQGHLLLTGPSVTPQTVAAGVKRDQPAQETIGHSTAGHQAQSDHTTSSGGRAAGARTARGASAQHLDARLAAELQPVLGDDPGRLAVGVIDLKTGATASYDADQPIRGGDVVTTDILAAMLLEHQQAGTQLSGREAQLATQMIEDGSIPAATKLWSLVGGAPGMAAANSTLKLRGTVPAPVNWTWTSTTVADQLQLLADLVEPGSPLHSAARDYALGLMTDSAAGQRWGVLAGASKNTAAAVNDGRLVGPAWVVGSIGVIQHKGTELLVAVLSDHNPAQNPALTAVQAAVLRAVAVVG
jgi:beta-lactamase class A